MTKTLRLALFILVCSLWTSAVSAQEVFHTGFENWTDGVPDQFMGQYTTMAPDRYYEILFTPRTGTKALGLHLDEQPASRITTVGLHVTAGELYDFRFWVRGHGRIRTTVHDGRAENDGFAPDNAELEINSPDAYQQVLQQVLVMNTTALAEFVITVEGMESGDILMIDDLYITESTLPTPLAATIAQIQETAGLWGYSPLEFTFVRTQGIVTGVGTESYFIQDVPGAWNGIQVRAAPPAGMALGDSITVLATVAEAGGIDETWYRTMTQLIGVEYLQVHATGRPLPEAVPITAAEAQHEDWEGVRVRIADLECMDLPEPLVGEWTAANWLGSIVVDDLLYATWPTVGSFYSITGIVQYAGEAQLLPIGPADIEAGVGIAEAVRIAPHTYPVPARDAVTVRLPHSSTAAYQLLDIAGRLVLQGRWNGSTLTLDLSGVPEGTYAFRSSDGNALYSTRIVVQR
jgi:hypothetical protein